MSNIAHTYYPQSGRLVVLGAGESGVGAAILGKDRGFDVLVSDRDAIAFSYRNTLLAEEIAFEERGHTLDRIYQADLVIKSPGIPDTVEFISELRRRGIPVISEIEFAAQYTDAKLICITGSNGKTTTSMLTYRLLWDAGVDVGLAGNIGHSFALQVARSPREVFVLELSSFMLDDMYHFRADIAVLLNITADHLDRYDFKIENYVASKFRVLRNQSEADVFIYCMDDPHTAQALARFPTAAQSYPFSQKEKLHMGAFLDANNDLTILLPNREAFIMNIEELSLQGKHNVYNNMASGLVAKAQELRNQTMKESMGSFVNVEHRLEHVACIGGVNYINDSKATNVNSVWYALESFSSDIVLIMGGVDKGNDYEMMRDLVRDKVKAIICIGKENGRIHEAFEEDTEVIVNSASMSDAVQIASHLAKKGDTVLLSPACASFDWFKNYEDRGNQFKDAVMTL